MISTELDMSARYSVAGYVGVAFRLLGWSPEDQYEGDVIVCDDEDCDHALSEMCWAEGGWSIVQSDSIVRAVMIGDDREHLVDVGDLTLIADEDYCHECGQLGCGHDGRDS